MHLKNNDHGLQLQHSFNIGDRVTVKTGTATGQEKWSEDYKSLVTSLEQEATVGTIDGIFSGSKLINIKFNDVRFSIKSDDLTLVE